MHDLSGMMNPDPNQHMDATDVLVKVALFGCFIVFAICMWLIRQGRDRRKNAGGREGTPPKLPRG